MKRRALVLACTLSFALLCAAMAQAGHQKLYVLLSATDHVAVVDVATDRLVKIIEVGKEPHGIASPRSQELLYVSTEGDNGLTVVDTVKDEVVDRHPGFGGRPNEIDVTSDGRLVYVPALMDGVYEVFDTQKKKIVARIPTDGFPHNVVISPDDRFAYLSPMDRGPYPEARIREMGLPMSFNEKVYVVEVATNTIIATIPVADAPRPIALHPRGHRLYANRDGLLGFEVLDIHARKVVATAEFVMTREEKATPSRSHGIGITPDGREVWSTDINNGVVHVFDVTSDEPKHLARLATGRTPLWLTITPDGKKVYVSNTADDTISAFDVASKKELTRIQFEKGRAPKRILVLDVPTMEEPSR